MPNVSDSWDDYCREVDDGPTIEHFENCQICGDRSEHACDTCERSFCRLHIEIVKPSADSPVTLEKICDWCQVERTRNHVRYLLDAQDHQLLNPFTPEYSDAIQALFNDGIRYNVWTWAIAPEEAA